MKVLIFRPKNLPLPIPNSGDFKVSCIKYKGCEFIKYDLDLDTFMKYTYRFIYKRFLRDIPQLIYLRDVPSSFKLSDVYSRLANVHMLSQSNGYYSQCLISNAKYVKPVSADIGGAKDLIARMYREYKANELLESL